MYYTHTILKGACTSTMKKLTFVFVSLVGLVCSAVDVVALRNVAAMMPAGGDHTAVLPNQVAGLSATGEILGNYNVTWDYSDLVFNVDDIVPVPGTARVGADTLTVTGFVRVASNEGTPVCVSSGVAPTCPSRAGGSGGPWGANQLAALTDGAYTDKSWGTWNRYNNSVFSNENFTLTFALLGNKKIKSFSFWHHNEGVKPAPYVAYSASSNGVDWTEQQEVAYSAYDFTEMRADYSLGDGVDNVRYFRITLGVNTDGSEIAPLTPPYQYLIIDEIEIYGIDNDVNLAQSASSLTMYSRSDGSVTVPDAGTLCNLTNGVIGVKGSWGDANGDCTTYTASNAKVYDISARFTWDGMRKVKNLICYTHQNIKPDITVKDKSGNVLGTTTANDGASMYGAYPKLNQHLSFLVDLPPDTIVDELVVDFDNQNHNYIGYIGELIIIGEDVSSSGPASYDSADLSEIKVDGTPLSGFNSTVHSYSVVQGREITSAKSHVNTGITILPRDYMTDSAYVVTVSEDGSATDKYTVYMPEVVALRNVATMVQEGADVPLTLGSKVKGLGCMGDVLAEYGVTWYTNGLEFVAGSTVQVPGTSTVNQVKMEVLGSVRVVSAISGGQNFADSVVYARGGTSPTTAVLNPKTEGARVEYVTNTDEPGQNYYDNDNVITSAGYDNQMVLAVGWESAKTISKVRVCYIRANWGEVPSEYTFYSDTNFVNEISVAYVVHVKSVPCVKDFQWGAYRWVDYHFAAPVTTAELALRTRAPGMQHRIFRFWPMYDETDESAKAAYENTDLNELAVGGMGVELADGVYEYRMPSHRGVTAASASCNTGITAIPRDERTGFAYVVTVSESGFHTGKYTIDTNWQGFYINIR